jgi:hypothetical protein
MNSEFRLCPACRAPNTVQDAACAACGAPLPKVAKAPVPTFDAIPGRQEARQAARAGVRRGLLVGVASAAVLGLLVARTFRSPSLQDGSAQTANATSPTPAPSPQSPAQPGGIAPVGAVPVTPPGWERPNPYANPAGMPQPGLSPAAAAGSMPASGPASVPAVIIGAPGAGSRPSQMAEATPVRNTSKPASYTDADLARVRNEAVAEPAPEARPPASPAPSRSPAKDVPRDETRLRERREAVRAAQQRVDDAQAAVEDIRREARENDDDGLQEQLSDSLSELKSAQRDLAHARRKLQELEDQPPPVLPPQ